MNRLRSTSTLTLLSLCVSAILVSFGLPHKVLAAGESYTWNGSTITGNGGLFAIDQLEPKAPINFQPSQVKKLDGSPASYIATQSAKYGLITMCNLTYTISEVSTDGKSAKIAAQGSGLLSNVDPGSGFSLNYCQPNLSGNISIGGNPPGTPENTAAEEAKGDVCQGTGVELGWIVCNMVNTIAEAAEGLDKIVLNLLIIDTEAIFNNNNTPDNQSSKAFHTAWGVFRNIAYAILVILGLFMILSQILGLEMFDAYTVRKMLPRLIIAVIFISLSWVLLDYLFSASNDAAFAIMDLIKAPFKDINAGIGVSGGDIALGILIQFVLAPGAVIGGVAFVAILGWGGVLAIVGSVLLAVFSAFVLLAARNVVADLLIIMAPVAIICSAFQPFEKLFTLWRTLLITMLVSVPAIAAIIQLSHVAALIAFISDAH